MSLPHKTKPILVWVDVDIGIANAVCWLNTIEGIRTIACCQGTIGEGGKNPYGAYVMATWTPKALKIVRKQFHFKTEGKGWGYLYPKTAPQERRA